jgi:putative ABC transport system substrate-binding protein
MNELKQGAFNLLVALLAVLIGGTAAAFAQSARKPIRIGLFVSGFPTEYAAHDQGIVAGLRSHGYVEGKNLTVERRYAQLQPERMASLAQEFARMDLHALVTVCTFSTKVALNATRTTPIIMLSVSDPVGLGVATSLPRPGGNVTGRSSLSRELIPKMMELFHEAVPTADRIAVLMNTHNPAHEPLWEDALRAAQRLNLTLVPIATALPAGFDAAMQSVLTMRAKALFILPDDPPTLHLRSRLADFAEQHALPLFGSYTAFETGALLSYGENVEVTARESVAYIDKIVHGANPAELPIEQPTRFELSVNMRVAKQLGITIPQSVLVRANRIVE